MSQPILYTIYGPSREFPRSYVIRRWRMAWQSPGDKTVPDAELLDTGLPLVIAPSLEGCREMIPPGLVRMEREPDDDVSIIESWVEV